MRRAAGIFLTGALALTACSSASTPEQDRALGLDFDLAAALQPFSGCDDFVSYYHDNADELLNQFGFFGGPIALGGITGGVAVLEDDSADFGASDGGDRLSAPEAAPSAPNSGEATSNAGGQAGVDFSTTNVQEEGVDESDIVKTDGSRMFTLANGELISLDVSGDEPSITGRVRLESYGGEIFMHDDTVAVLGFGEGSPLPLAADSRLSRPDFYLPRTVVQLIDVSDPADMQVVNTLTIEGNRVSARMVGSVMRLVVQSEVPPLDLVYPSNDSEGAINRANDANREAIREAKAEEFLPQYVVENASGDSLTGTIVDCEDVSRPSQFSGLGMLSVMTFNIDNRSIGETVGVVARGEQIYASTDNLYVATTRALPIVQQQAANFDFERVAQNFSTDLHKFDISDPTKATYEASGQVRGTVLNQFSMSEYEGDLRVATTDGAPWFTTPESESFVTVLRQDGDELNQVGQVGNLGKGERIFAVRYVADKAFVVTFRQTDPLYTVDLATPESPQVLGELKINGFSSYLHPIEEPGYLIGVGQDATDEGRTIGTQVSLFDVTDLSSPQRIAQATVEGGSSTVEFDAKAFLYWAAEDLAVLPVSAFSFDEQTGTESSFNGVIGYRVNPETGISEVGRISHPAEQFNDGRIGIPIEPGLVDPPAPFPGDAVEDSDVGQTEPVEPDSPPPSDEFIVEPGFAPVPYSPQISRAIVIGDSIYTLSSNGLLRSDLTTFEAGTFISFQ